MVSLSYYVYIYHSTSLYYLFYVSKYILSILNYIASVCGTYTHNVIYHLHLVVMLTLHSDINVYLLCGLLI